jgi:hypothetical protein
VDLERDTPARGDGIPGRVGKGLDDVLALETARWARLLSSGERGSRATNPAICEGGVSSASETTIQPLGERKVEPDRSDDPEIGVAVCFDKTDTRGLGLGATGAEVDAEEVAVDDTARLAARGIGPDTLRLGTFVPSLSSVALSRAWRSCSNLKPFDFADTTLFGPGLGCGRPVRDLDMAGDNGVDAEAARLREVVDRASVGMPEGDEGIWAENRFAAGDMVGIEEMVLMVLDRVRPDGVGVMIAVGGAGDLAIGVGGATVELERSMWDSSSEASCTGDIWTDTDDGGVGTERVS